jgi:hypothetical protein
VLRVECSKCARKGRYSVRKLIDKYGRKANLMKWREQLNRACAKRDARSMVERCDQRPVKDANPRKFTRISRI